MLQNRRTDKAACSSADRGEIPLFGHLPACPATCVEYPRAIATGSSCLHHPTVLSPLPTRERREYCIALLASTNTWATVTSIYHNFKVPKSRGRDGSSHGWTRRVVRVGGGQPRSCQTHLHPAFDYPRKSSVNPQQSLLLRVLDSHLIQKLAS